jgi:hypothetical protein
MKPPRDKKYRAWIRTLPCAICYPAGLRQRSHTEAAHTHDGSQGMSQKSSDYSVIPLCGLGHHQFGPESYHVLGEKEFERRHGINCRALAAELRTFYREHVECASSAEVA